VSPSIVPQRAGRGSVPALRRVGKVGGWRISQRDGGASIRAVLLRNRTVDLLVWDNSVGGYAGV
jgi:hypothetical protein